MSDGSWTETTATLSVVGTVYTVLRPAFVIALYGDDDLRPQARELFDAVWSVLPPDRSWQVVTKKSRSWKGLRGLPRLRETLANVASEGQLYVIKDAGDWNVGEHQLELRFGSQPSQTVHLALPPAFVDRDPDAAFAFVGDLVERFPLLLATAGYGFALDWSREGEMKGMPAAIRAGLRFPGLGVRNRTQEGLMYGRLESAAWLTFVSGRLLGELGPDSVLDPRVARRVGPHGVLVRAGATPPVDAELEPLRSVDAWIRPLRLEAWDVAGRNLFDLPPAEADAWLHRLAASPTE